MRIFLFKFDLWKVVDGLLLGNEGGKGAVELGVSE